MAVKVEREDSSNLGFASCITHWIEIYTEADNIVLRGFGVSATVL